jgi:uncharacterized protein
MNLEQVREYHKELKALAQKFGISQIYIFGSTARGEQTPASDIDFMVEMEPGVSLFSAAGFSYEAEQLLGIKVDVVPAAALDQNRDRKFLETILREAVDL